MSLMPVSSNYFAYLIISPPCSVFADRKLLFYVIDTSHRKMHGTEPPEERAKIVIPVYPLTASLELLKHHLPDTHKKACRMLVDMTPEQLEVMKKKFAQKALEEGESENENEVGTQAAAEAGA